MFSFVRLDIAEVKQFAEKNAAISSFVDPFIAVETKNDMVYFANYTSWKMKENTIKLSAALRPINLDDKYKVFGVDKNTVTKNMHNEISRVKVTITNIKKQKYTTEDLNYALEKLLADIPIYKGQTYAFRIKNSDLFACHIDNLFCVQEDEKEVEKGFTLKSDMLSVIATSNGFVELEHQRLRKAFDPDKWDFKSIQIGGLNEELFTILRRAFLSRLMKPELRLKLKQKHVKGMLLYGPPGSGKTLIARKIGTMLGLKENDDRIRIVNGPELFSKWSGEAETRLREIFTTKSDDLHVLIFDEIEASARKRDSNSEITGRFVTQFLALLDGVKEQENIFVIGMTNRKDLIDPAMLRPGRLEIHVEIALPDESGRKEIFHIHTESLRNSKMLSEDIDVDELARKSKNFTGAEIEALVKSAISFATTKASKLSDISEMESILVTSNDFDMAFSEVMPAFGTVYEDLDKYVRHGILPFPNLDPSVAINYLNNLPSTSFEQILIHGEHGTGCSAWAASIVKKAKFDFIKFVTPYKYLEMTDGEILRDLSQLIRDAFRSQNSLLVIDDFERLVKLTTIGGINFSHSLLNGLTTLLNESPPTGNKFTIVVTSHDENFMLQTGINFNKTFELKKVYNIDLLGIPNFLPEKIVSLGIPIKILCTELAKQN